MVPETCNSESDFTVLPTQLKRENQIKPEKPEENQSAYNTAQSASPDANRITLVGFQVPLLTNPF
jgi:hypothetical protein